MDILDSAQQQINSAANQIVPGAAASPPPEPPPAPIKEPSIPAVPPPVTNPPPELKEEALLPPSEPAPTVTPVPTSDSITPDSSSGDNPVLDSPPQESKTTTFGGTVNNAPGPETSPKLPDEPASTDQKLPTPPAKKGLPKAVLLGVLFLLLATLPVVIFYASQRQKQIAEIRSQAGDNCCGSDGRECKTDYDWQAGYYACQAHACSACPASGGGGGGTSTSASTCPSPAKNCTITCNNGQSFSDPCPANGAFSSCTQWANQACASRGGIKTGGTTTSGTTTTGTTTGGTTTTKTVSTVGVPVGQDSGCCSSTSQCQLWFGSSSTCANLNGACSTGVQCKGGGCGESCNQSDCGRVICQGTSYQQTCNAGCVSPCGDFICGAGENAQNCPKDCKTVSTTTTVKGTSFTTSAGACTQVNGQASFYCTCPYGYSCIGLSGTAHTEIINGIATTCYSAITQTGKITCSPIQGSASSISGGGGTVCDNPLSRSVCGSAAGCAEGSQRLCQRQANGQYVLGTCVVADACATQVQTVSSGDQCSTLKRLSVGEKSKGSFVGCSGTQNCFCPGIVNVGSLAGAGTVTCYADNYNDSCGAPGVQTTVPIAASIPAGGCQSDWCTTSQECSAAGGTVGTPKTFDHCQPTSLVACCVPPAGTVTATSAGPTPTPVGQCTRIKVYKDTVAVNPTTLTAGDSVLLAVAGTTATKGRIRINGGTFTETTTKNASNEFTVPFTVPTGITNFTIEAEVFTNGQWK